jgi:Peptidase family M23
MTTLCMRRLVTLFLAAALIAALAPAAFADTDDVPAEDPVVEEPEVEVPPEPAIDDPTPKPSPRRPPHRVRRVKVTRDIVFPIVGRAVSINGFGSCRDNCTREHHGVDILTYRWKGLPVVAAHDGVITLIRDDGAWCNVHITGADGWSTRYVHLNNDTPGYDDEDYPCIPDGLEVGSEVQAGQLIGWVGDSGNAESTQPHVHFEIRTPSGLPVDPLASLKAARHLDIRQVGSSDPAATAAEIALYAYPEGAPTVTLMAMDDYLAMLRGGFAPLELDGPLLLADWERIPQVTLEAIASLAPARIDVMGDLWLPDVLGGLAGTSEVHEGARLELAVANALDAQAMMVETSDSPSEEAPAYADGIASVAVNAAAPSEPEPAPFSIVMLGDRDELGSDEAFVFAKLAERVSTTIMDFVEPTGRLGNAAFEGIGSSGSRYTLYFATGDEWQTYRASERPEESPGYGCFVVEPGTLSKETLTFLSSIADAPVMPLWR